MPLASNAPYGTRRGDKRDSPLRAFTPKRIAIIAAGLLLCIWMFGKGTGVRDTSSSSSSMGSAAKAGGVGAEGVVGKVAFGGVDKDTKNAVKAGAAQENIPVENLPADSPQKQPGLPAAAAAAGGVGAVGSALKPGAAGSKPCTPPPGQKAQTYALMIDAGSTGSRLHLYTFSHCDPDPKAMPKLESEGFFTTKPGLSAYAGNPKGAAESLRGLMEHANEGVPKGERSCTPVAVKATAGLRLLGDKESRAILDSVEEWLKEEWEFSVVDEGVVVMDGRDEGVYAWITINFLLGLIGPANADPTSSAAIMDLGGASTQIVFEPTFDPKSHTKLAPGDHVYDLDFASTPHVLYQYSHLGYGLMQARRAVHNLVAFSYVWQSAPRKTPVVWEKLTVKDRIHNPCMFKGEEKVVELDPPGRQKVQVTMVGTGAGFEACRRVVEVMIAKDAVCEEPPCAFAGVYQPSLGEVFAAGKVWALSYFYDRIAPLGLTSPFLISDLRKLTSDVCKGRDSPTWSRFKGNKEAAEELSDRPEYCLDLTFMYSLLSLGYELDDERQIWMGKKVDGVELGWALGAAIAMIDGHLTCRAD